MGFRGFHGFATRLKFSALLIHWDFGLSGGLCTRASARLCPCVWVALREVLCPCVCQLPQ